MGVSGLATMLDLEMLIANGAVIHSPTVSDAALPERAGSQVARELGGRYLLRFVRPHQLGTLIGGSIRSQWVTPTPYSRAAAVRWLALPDPLDPPGHTLVLDPEAIAVLAGPRLVRLGGGIEYLLPEGFSRDAIVPPGWEVEVT